MKKKKRKKLTLRVVLSIYWLFMRVSYKCLLNGPTCCICHSQYEHFGRRQIRLINIEETAFESPESPRPPLWPPIITEQKIMEKNINKDKDQPAGRAHQGSTRPIRKKKTCTSSQRGTRQRTILLQHSTALKLTEQFIFVYHFASRFNFQTSRALISSPPGRSEGQAITG